MTLVAAGLLLVMAAVLFIAKGQPRANDLPFIDETTSTSASVGDGTTTSTAQESEEVTTTSESDPVGSTPAPAFTTTTSEAPTTTTVPTSIGDEPVETIAPLSPSSSAPESSPATVPDTTLPSEPAPTTGSPTTATPTTVTPTTAEPAGPQLIFAEEFDSFNSNIWTKENSTYGDGNNELQCYIHDMVSVANGRLVLRAEARTETCPNGSTRDVVSGMVRSRGVQFAPGQSIEFRVKLTPDDETNQSGLWPAFWSSGWAGGWPAGGEWDGLEVMTANNPKRSVYSIHYANSAGQHGKTSKELVSPEDFSAAWHIIKFDYGDEGVLTWYMDGNVVSVIDSADTIQGYPAPFDQAMTELKINLALGGSPGPLDLRALPATFEVDYIRIYS